MSPTSQGALFLLNSPLSRDIRGERSRMAFPFFAPTKNAWLNPFAYATPTVRTYDKEIVLYIASLMASTIEEDTVVA
jgi:hypothetical protein